MKLFSLSCVLLALAVPVAAQTPARDTTRQLSLAGTGVISGIVVDAEGKPMRRVTVRIEGDPRANRSLVTDDAGTFRFTRVPAGEFSLIASKPAYPEVSYGAKRPGRRGAKIQLKDGARVEGLSLRLEKGAVLSGVVRNDRGQPVPGVSLSVSRVYTALDGSFATTNVLSGSTFPVTDDRGAFRFYGLAPGEYIVGTSAFFGSGSSARLVSDDEMRAAFTRAQAAVANPEQAAASGRTIAPQVDYGPVFYPAAQNAADAARITVAAGEEHDGLDMTLVLRPMASISGQVSGLDPDAPGRPADRVEMMLATLARGSVLHTGSNDDLSFSFRGLAAGDYTVVARTQPPSMKIASADISLNGQDVSGVSLVLAPPLSVAGRLVIDAANPQALSMSQVTIAASPVSSRDSTVLVSTKPLADGTFTLDGLLPGHYRIRTILSGTSGSAVPYSLASVTVGGADVTDVSMTLLAGASVPPMVVTITDDGSSMSGTLTTADGKPATGYFVVAVASDQKYWIQGGRRVLSVRPDADGHYVFKDLPAGAYRIAATTDLESTDLADRTFLQQIVAASTEVTVAPKEKKVFDLRLGGGS